MTCMLLTTQQYRLLQSTKIEHGKHELREDSAGDLPHKLNARAYNLVFGSYTRSLSHDDAGKLWIANRLK